MARYVDTSTNPLATEPVGKLIHRFAIPTIVSMLVGAIYNIVDQIYIGHGIGMLGIAATNIAFPLTIICTAVSLLLGVGCAANFNLSLGAGKTERAARMVGTVLTLMVLVGVASVVLANIFMDTMLDLFGMTSFIEPFAVPYSVIVSYGFPFLIFSNACSHLIRADGSPAYSMLIMLAGAIFNVVADPIFLFVFDMGIEGIAWATTLGQVLSAGIALYYMLKKFQSVRIKKSYLRPKSAYIRAIMALGIAAFFNQIAMMFVQIVLNNTLRHYGALSPYGSEIPLAAVGLIMKTNFIFMAIVIGIAQSCQPIIGFNYGAQNYHRVKKTFKLAITIATGISLVAFITFQAFPHLVIAVFGARDLAYVRFAVRYMRIFMFMTVANGIQPVTSNFFTSIGRAKLGVLMSLTRQGIFLLPLIFLLPIFLGIDGVMFAGPIADTATVLLAVYLTRGEFDRMDKLEATGQ